MMWMIIIEAETRQDTEPKLVLDIRRYKMFEPDSRGFILEPLEPSKENKTHHFRCDDSSSKHEWTVMMAVSESSDVII